MSAFESKLHTVTSIVLCINAVSSCSVPYFSHHSLSSCGEADYWFTRSAPCHNRHQGAQPTLLLYRQIHCRPHQRVHGSTVNFSIGWPVCRSIYAWACTGQTIAVGFGLPGWQPGCRRKWLSLVPLIVRCSDLYPFSSMGLTRAIPMSLSSASYTVAWESIPR